MVIPLKEASLQISSYDTILIIIQYTLELVSVHSNFLVR